MLKKKLEMLWLWRSAKRSFQTFLDDEQPQHSNTSRETSRSLNHFSPSHPLWLSFSLRAPAHISVQSASHMSCPLVLLPPNHPKWHDICTRNGVQFSIQRLNRLAAVRDGEVPGLRLGCMTNGQGPSLSTTLGEEERTRISWVGPLRWFPWDARE